MLTTQLGGRPGQGACRLCLGAGIHVFLLEGLIFGCDTEIMHLLPFLSVLILKPRHLEVTAGPLEEKLQAAGGGHAQTTRARGPFLCQRQWLKGPPRKPLPYGGSSKIQQDLTPRAHSGGPLHTYTCPLHVPFTYHSSKTAFSCK